MALPDSRTFQAGVPSVRGEEPLLIGLVGPPGGGKTVSALRLAAGMRAVRPGPVVLIDTEGGRSRKYSPAPGQTASLDRYTFEFLRVDMAPPFRSHDFLAAIKAQLPLRPAAIIVDSLSDEHEGEGGYLEWHDELVPKFGGNEWAAWSTPKAARKRLISGLLQIKVPILFTFRAREKTATEPGKGKGGKDKITNIGWMPVAPLEIVHTLDLTCILPPRADGVPVWSSEKVGEGFIVKLPAFLAPLIQEGALSEAAGAALARWAMGEAAASAPAPSGVQAGGQPGKKALLDEMGSVLTAAHGQDREKRSAALELAFGTWSKRELEKLDEAALQKGLAALKMNLNPAAHMEREPGMDSGTEPGEEG
jgi:hypothetical protein